ncbi:MAG: GNAT family N-acetyltransferase [Bacilli bacterium]|nr:GNAT family N-acetyltransferase [Bacilli bacterium]
MIKLVPFKDEEENYILMQRWCSQEFIYEWFEQRILSLDEIKHKYKTKLNLMEQDLFFIHYNGERIGYVQIYKYNNKLYGDLSKYNNIYELDLFIGEESYLSKGIGTHILNYITDYIYDKYKPETIVLRPFKRNIRAIKCYLKCNYEIIDEYDGVDSLGRPERYAVLSNVKGK